MRATKDRAAAETYETAAELVVRVELPEDVDVDIGDARVALHDGTLEIRLPRRIESERGAVGDRLLGFHPDAPPS